MDLVKGDIGYSRNSYKKKDVYKIEKIFDITETDSQTNEFRNKFHILIQNYPDETIFYFGTLLYNRQTASIANNRYFPECKILKKL